MSFFGLFVILLFYYQHGYAVSVNITKGNDLLHYLCQEKIDHDVTIFLNHSLVYNIDMNKSCVIDGQGSLSIMSDHMVNVYCLNKGFTSNVSLGFIWKNVIISNVTFISCGAPMLNFNNENFIAAINSSADLTFSNTSFAVLVFVNNAITLTNVIIDSYFGFAVIAFNIQNSTFLETTINSSLSGEVYSKNSVLIGSGILIYFTRPFHMSSTVSLRNCKFYANNNINFNSSCANEFIRLENLSNLAEISSSLAVVFNHLQYDDPGNRMILVSIQSSLFAHNIGVSLMVFMKNSSVGRVHILDNTYFTHNRNFPSCPGSALSFHMMSCNQSTIYNNQPLLLENVSIQIPGMFITYDSTYQEVPIYIEVANVVGIVDFIFLNVQFNSSYSRYLNRNMLVTMQQTDYSFLSKVHVFLENLRVSHTSQFNMMGGDAILDSAFIPDVGLFVFDNIHKVFINGSSWFSGSRGPVIQTHNSNVHLSGKVVFHSNVAKCGAAFNMKESFLYLCKDLVMEMNNNFAQLLGGAIFIANLFNTVVPKCAIQIEDFKHRNVSFNGNLAGYSGNTIHGVPLYQCYMINYGLVQSNIYKDYFKFVNTSLNSSANDLLDISTQPKQIIRCESSPHITHNHYPGETIQFRMAAIDNIGNYVSCFIKLSLVTVKSVYSNSFVSVAERFQYLNESHGNHCSIVNVTVTYKDSLGNISSLKLIVSSYESSHIFVNVSLNLISCPSLVGFRLRNGVCDCSVAVEKFLDFIGYQNGVCDINTLSIIMSPVLPNVWFSNTSSNSINGSFGISANCPFDICIRVIDFSKLKSNLIPLNIRLNSKTQTCVQDRMGILCGECKEGYSVVFGSGICMKCSNWWLLTGVLYVIIGPLLVYFIYALNLTLSMGTINGIIFYAQAANVGTLLYIQYFQNEGNEMYRQFLSVMLSLLNLNLGFPICFFNGMDEFVKTGLSVAFPLYLLVIVVVLIILSRYSLWLSNKTSHLSVQVLVTVVHISFSNLLNAIITVATPATIFVDGANETVQTHLVWNRYGKIPYGSHDHVMITVFIIVIAGIFLIPYTCLLITGKCIIKSTCGTMYFRPVYEAIHGPYKENRHFWFTARLFLLIAMFSIHSSTIQSGKHVSFSEPILPILIIFLFFQLLLRPFKSSLINILDSVVLLNLVFFFASVSYESFHGHYIHELYSIVIVLITLFLLQFLFIVFYHVSLFTKANAITSQLLKVHNVYRERIASQFLSIDEDSCLLSDASNSFHQPCDNFREPLLQDYK